MQEAGDEEGTKELPATTEGLAMEESPAKGSAEESPAKVSAGERARQASESPKAGKDTLGEGSMDWPECIQGGPATESTTGPPGEKQEGTEEAKARQKASLDRPTWPPVEC